MKLSFVIPIYNTEYSILKRCIESICKYDNSNYEIIMIDDGSTDDLSRQYKELINDNIKYYKKKNAGVSAARNIGIMKASGEYIMFVDSDDIVFIDELDFNILNKDYDAIYFNYLNISENGNDITNKEINSDNDCELNQVTMLKEFIEFDKYYAPWNKIFKRKFLISNKIEFNTNMINGEDAVFNFNVLLSNPKMYYCNKEIYGYYTAGNNYEKRVKNKFENILHDYLYKYEMKVNVIEKKSFEYRILKKIQNDAVEQIFRISMICSKYKMNKKREISNYIKKFKINKKDLSSINKLKYNSLCKQKWWSVHFLSKIRNIYLKIKRR